MGCVLITKESFQKEVMENESPVLVDVYAEWCAPCKIMNSAMEELSELYSDKIKICKVDIEQNSELATKYEIIALPTFLFFINGELVKKHVGVRSKQDLVSDIEEIS